MERQMERGIERGMLIGMERGMKSSVWPARQRAVVFVTDVCLVWAAWRVHTAEEGG